MDKNYLIRAFHRTVADALDVSYSEESEELTNLRGNMMAVATQAAFDKAFDEALNMTRAIATADVTRLLGCAKDVVALGRAPLHELLGDLQGRLAQHVAEVEAALSPKTPSAV